MSNRLSAETAPNVYVDEIRHRMMNSFQLMTSLGELRLQQARSPEAKKHLKWIIDRIHALALLQRRLAIAKAGAFKDYLQDVELQWNRLIEDRDISVLIDFEDGPAICGRDAVTLALITHELITNSVEHAFCDGTGGTIHVGLKPVPCGLAELSISDDGCGPPRKKPRRRKTKGLSLVASLSETIHGHFTMTANHPSGTRSILTFPIRS